MEAALRTAYWLITKKDLKEVALSDVRGLKGVKETQIDIKGNVVKIAVAHGLGNVEYVLRKIQDAVKNNKELPYHFIEVMACPGGCVGGGGQPYGVTDKLRLARAKGLYGDDDSRTLRCSHENPYVKKLYDEFLGKPLSEKSHDLLHTTYKARPLYKK